MLSYLITPNCWSFQSASVPWWCLLSLSVYLVMRFLALASANGKKSKVRFFGDGDWNRCVCDMWTVARMNEVVSKTVCSCIVLQNKETLVWDLALYGSTTPTPSVGVGCSVDKHNMKVCLIGTVCSGESQAHEAGDKSTASSEPTKRKRRHSAGPARERKPSFREEEKPLFNLFAVAVFKLLKYYFDSTYVNINY